MDDARRRRLEAGGWCVGTADDFLMSGQTDTCTFLVMGYAWRAEPTDRHGWIGMCDTLRLSAHGHSIEELVSVCHEIIGDFLGRAATSSRASDR